MPSESGGRRSNSRGHGRGSFRSRSGSRSTSRSSSQMRWVPKIPPVPEEGGATASHETPGPTQQSWADPAGPTQQNWADQGGHVNYSRQANWHWPDPGQDFPPDTGGTGPEAPPPPWVGPGPEPNKANRDDVLEASQGLNCPLCQKFVRGGRWQLRSHQLTSSRCLAASGQARAATEPCRYCGKVLAAGDAWAFAQHSRHCRGQTPRRGRSEEPSAAAASASGRRSLSRRPRARDRSESRRRRQAQSSWQTGAQQEPDWNDPATYFHRNPWEYSDEEEDRAFTAWLEGRSQPSPGIATTSQFQDNTGGANHEAGTDQRYHQEQTADRWRDWSRAEWDRYPTDPALWRERGWQDWSQGEAESNSSRYHDADEVPAVRAWRDHMWRDHYYSDDRHHNDNNSDRTSNSHNNDGWHDNAWRPSRHQQTQGWTSWRGWGQ